MYVIHATNVNDAYWSGVRQLRQFGQAQSSRAGGVVVAPMPVTTVYAQPTQRVLMDPNRDANPFFHLFESLWMLAGWNDATWLDTFVSDFSERFAEEGGKQHGAYGYRWRHTFSVDQLEVLIRLLRTNLDDRRIVLSMWSTWQDLGYDKKDIPCNTQAYFRVRNGRFLDITVCCRSNDIIWGAYGANAVHFSVLLEYMAAQTGLDVGVYYQISNNFHAYREVLDKLDISLRPVDPYARPSINPAPMILNSMSFDTDLKTFMSWTQSDKTDQTPAMGNLWFDGTACRMYRAALAWRERDVEKAISHVKGVTASDWRLAALEWLERRKKRMEKKSMKPQTDREAQLKEYPIG